MTSVNQMYDAWDMVDLSQGEISEAAKKNPSKDAWDQLEIQESFGKSAARTALQIPQGVAEATPFGMAAGLWNIIGQGEVFDPEEIDRLKEISKREGIPFDEEAYLEAGRNALSYIPTVSNIASEAEARTGLPLEPKNRLQKGLRFASSASKAIPKSGSKAPKGFDYKGTPESVAPKGYAFRGTNTGLPRPVLGTGIEGVRELLIEMGIPEPIADFASFAIIKPTTETSGLFKVGATKKDSGLTKRRYEKIDKPVKVSQSTINKINESTESEFRDLTDKIIEKSPIKETHENLARDASFKKNVSEGFEKVQELADTLPKTFETKSLKNDLKNLIAKKKNEGLTPSEFDEAHNKFIQKFIKETPNKPFTASQLVKQYRKNNRQLTEAFEPGQSFGYNRAKREALLDYNRTIADMIEREFPNSEFAKLFKETNKKWADISNSESITKFLDDLFDGKINFKKARQLFDKQGMTVPFKRAMGEEGFAKFETLINDLLSTEQASKLLKVAEQKGFGDLAKTAGAYILHPSAAKAKLGYDTLKGGYNKIYEMLLDKPQIGVSWDRGINAMKRGDFKVAQQELGKVKAAEQAFDASEKSRIDALKKFNEKKAASQVNSKSQLKSAPKKTKIQALDQELSKAYDKLMKLDEEFVQEARSGKKINPIIRSQKIKRFDAAQKRVDDLRDEIDRQYRLQKENEA